MNKVRYVEESELASKLASKGDPVRPVKKVKKRAQSKDVRRLQSADPQARNPRVPAKSSKKKLQTRVSPADQMLYTMSGLDRQRMLNVNLSPFNVGYQYGKSKGGNRNGEIDQAMIGEYLLMLQQLRNPTGYVAPTRSVPSANAYYMEPQRQLKPKRPKSRVRQVDERQVASGDLVKPKKKKKIVKKGLTNGSGAMVQIKPPTSGKKIKKKKTKTAKAEEKDFRTIEEKDEIEEEDGFKESGRKKLVNYDEDVKIDDDERGDDQAIFNQIGSHEQVASKKGRVQDDLIKVDVGEDRQGSKARAEARRKEEEEADRRKMQDEDNRRQRERAERDRQDRERAENEKKAEKERKEKQEKERQQKEQADRDRRERDERDRIEKERADRERKERNEQAERERKAEQVKIDKEREDRERYNREKAELEKAEREKKERDMMKHTSKSVKEKQEVGDFQIDVPQMDDNLGDDDDQEVARDEPSDEGLIEGDEEELNDEMIQFYNEIPTLTELTEESIHEFKQKMLEHIVKYQIFNSEEFQSLYQATSYKNQEVEEDIITNIFEELATALEEKLGEEGEGLEEGFSDQGDL